MRTKTKKTSEQPQARENAGDQVVNGFSLHLIGCESDTSFLDQSQSEVELNQSNPWLLLTLNWKLPCNVIVLPVSFQRRFPSITSNLSGKHKSFAVCLSTLSAIIIFWKICHLLWIEAISLFSVRLALGKRANRIRSFHFCGWEPARHITIYLRHMSVIFYLNEVFKEWYYRSVKQFTNAASKLTFEYSRSLLFVFCSYFRPFFHQGRRGYEIKLIKKFIYLRSLCTSIPVCLRVTDLQFT